MKVSYYYPVIVTCYKGDWMTIESNPLDLIWGVEEIAKLIGRTERQTYHMIKAGHLPVVKQVGERYVASRSKLVAFFLEDAA